MNSSIAWPSNPRIEALLILIGLLFLYGLSLSWRALSAVRSERRAAQDLTDRKGLMLDRDTLALQLGASSPRLAGQLLHSMLQQQGLAFARPSDVLDPVLDSAARIVAPARTVPNLLLLFGLIGTVVGLAYTLSSLGPQIQGAINAGDPKTVAQSLGLTLREMGGAFAGTLWGVTGAFLLQGINAFTGIQAEQLAGDLDRMSMRFAPDIYPASSEKQIASLTELVASSKTVLTETQAEMAKTSRQFEQVLQEAGGVIQRSLETLETTSKDISRALQQASGDVRQSSEHLTVAVNAIKNHQEDFRNIYSAFSEMFDRSMQALKLHSDGELKEIRELQAAFGTSGAQIVQEILKSTAKMDQVSQDLARGESAYLLATEGVTTSIKAGFDRLDTQLGATLKTYTTEVTSVSSRLDGLRETLGASQAASTSLERTLRAKDDAEHTRLKDQLHSEQTLMAATARLTTSLDQLSPVITALQESPDRLMKVLEDQQAQLMTSWRSHVDQADDRLVQATLETHRRLEATLGAVGSRIEQAVRPPAPGRAVTGPLTLKKTDDGRPAGAGSGSPPQSSDRTLNASTQVLQDLLTQLHQRSSLEQAERGALQTALEQNRESALTLTRILETLPAQMQTAELVQGQRQLASTMGRLLGGLERDLQQQEDRSA